MVESRSAPLFGLAPGDACRAVCVATNAVGSYPTVSPLPDPAINTMFGGRPSAVYSLLRLCRIAPPGSYPAPCPWSPDFPPALRPAIIQPSLSRTVSITMACGPGKRIRLCESDDGRIDPPRGVCYSPAPPASFRSLQDVQKGLPARPQGARRLRPTLSVGRRETGDRERSWRPFSTSYE